MQQEKDANKPLKHNFIFRLSAIIPYLYSEYYLAQLTSPTMDFYLWILYNKNYKNVILFFTSVGQSQGCQNFLFYLEVLIYSYSLTSYILDCSSDFWVFQWDSWQIKCYIRWSNENSPPKFSVLYVKNTCSSVF